MATRFSLIIALLAAAVVAGWLWLRAQPQPAAPAPPVAAAPAPAPAPPPAEQPFPAPPAPDSPLQATEVGPAVETLVGRKQATRFLQTDAFVRRIAATVDNLGRSHAPSAVWPVQVTPGRFSVNESGGATVIGADNDARYTPFVLFAEAVDARAATDLYVRMYPLLQAAYRELGFPKGEFNDRLLRVIDLLLATPVPEQPPAVKLLEIKGPVAPERPWVRYEFADPALESLSAGQKILLRTGAVNERRLKKKLAELRTEIAARNAKR